MWRLWLLTGQTLGFVTVVAPVLWVNSPAGTGLRSVVVAALVLSGLFHFLALEAFSYPETKRSEVAVYARRVGGWRYMRGGFLFGAAGAAAGCLVGYGLGSPFEGYGWLAFFCPVLALVFAIGWASWVPEEPTGQIESPTLVEPTSTFTSGLPRFPGAGPGKGSP